MTVGLIYGWVTAATYLLVGGSFVGSDTAVRIGAGMLVMFVALGWVAVTTRTVRG